MALRGIGFAMLTPFASNIIQLRCCTSGAQCSFWSITCCEAERPPEYPGAKRRSERGNCQQRGSCKSRSVRCKFAVWHVGRCNISSSYSGKVQAIAPGWHPARLDAQWLAARASLHRSKVCLELPPSWLDERSLLQSCSEGQR